ncbi:sigma-70 family RNA polymerase sigma factor [Elioraea sp.]|uniref:sigma-70 family RNA polymerase sigma factor n=1 Tax=Elioraea sp. TaxID=2185103 RepID=UPI00307D0EEF
MPDSFHDDLIAMLPKLRIQALALTRNRAAAEDLVQDTVVNALAARAQFRPGTNLAAWLHRILRNRFISDLRKRRPNVPIEDAPIGSLAAAADPSDRLVAQELARALDRLPADQRETLLLVTLQGLSCEEAAEVTGAAVGTVKSRVFRARATLERALLGEAAGEPAAASPAPPRHRRHAGTGGPAPRAVSLPRNELAIESGRAAGSV